MKNIITLVILLVITPKVMCQTYKIENRHLARILQVTDGRLSTQSIVNKQAKTTLRPISCDEFAIRFSLPGSKDSADCYVSAKDFAVVSVSPYSNPQCPKSKGYRFRLQGKQHGLSLDVCYELAEDDSYCRKHLKLTSDRDIRLKRIDVEAIAFEDAHQNYTIKKITAQGSAQWKPGLGHPCRRTEMVPEDVSHFPERASSWRRPAAERSVWLYGMDRQTRIYIAPQSIGRVPSLPHQIGQNHRHA